MSKLLNLILLSFLCVSLSVAQQRPSFAKFLEEKTNFIISEMGLPDDASARFREMYGDLQKEKGELMRRYDAVYKVMQKHRRGEKISDQEYLEAVRAEVQRNQEDAELQARYIKKFETVLTPEQLYRYMMAEQHFKSQFMNHHGRPGHGQKGGERPQGEPQHKAK